MQSTLVLICCHNRLTAWKMDALCRPQCLPVQAQESLTLHTAHTLIDAYDDVMARLRGLGAEISGLLWILDANARQWWRQVLPKLAPQFPPVWQCLAWEWLAARFGLPPSVQPDQEVLSDHVLPWLLLADAAAERTRMHEALVREHEIQKACLADERARLQEENERLRAQNAALQQMDLERLVTYLPALFERVFNVIGPVDLALLCGRIEPPDIPNPYPEPSEEALCWLQRKFRALPRGCQQKIVAFVDGLPHRQRLKPRPEMRELLEELREEEAPWR